MARGACGAPQPPSPSPWGCASASRLLGPPLQPISDALIDNKTKQGFGGEEGCFAVVGVGGGSFCGREG